MVLTSILESQTDTEMTAARPLATCEMDTHGAEMYTQKTGPDAMSLDVNVISPCPVSSRGAPSMDTME